MNLYRYVGNNNILLNDPLGLTKGKGKGSPWTQIIAAIIDQIFIETIDPAFKKCHEKEDEECDDYDECIKCCKTVALFGGALIVSATAVACSGLSNVAAGACLLILARRVGFALGDLAGKTESCIVACGY